MVDTSDVNQSVGREPEASTPRGRWWLDSRIRLGVLLACLAVAVLALFNGSGVFSAASTAAAGSECSSAPTPRLAETSLNGLLRLRAASLGVIAPVSPRIYSVGSVAPDVAWTDDPPVTLRASRQASGLWPASWEIRVWTSERDDLVVDAFAFAGAAEAGRFLALASGAHCHRSALAAPAQEPAGARNLTWVNPDGPTQEDVFLRDGPRVYRVAAVRPPGAAPRAQRREGLAMVDRLACALPGARCPLVPG